MVELRRGWSGSVGERIAAWFLTDRECSVVGRNLRADGGEIDLLIRDGTATVVVEVKTTSDGSDPFDPIDDRKMALIERTASSIDAVVHRFDAVGVEIADQMVTVRWLRGIEASMSQRWVP